MSQFYLKCALISAISLSTFAETYAQQALTGKISDAKGNVSGVSVTVKGTTRATQSDLYGSFSINASSGEILRFSAVGYKAKEIPVTDAKTINITLEEDATNLGEVVVTAMGIKREKKSLGYAFQDVKSETLVDARENNVANALSGKVSGLQVVKGSNGPGSSSKIVLRGNNSLTGDNQPLIVVDGVPMENFTGAENNDFWNPSADMGNGLGDLNPDDIESMSVLKGGAASALYGSRAGNGVILITTKSGKAKDGAGISYSATLGLEEIFMTPKLQKSFGQGENGSYLNNSSLSWGPKIEGQEVSGYDGKTRKLSNYNNIDNFFKTGISTTHNLTLQQRLSEGTSIFTSLNYLHDDSKIPGAKLDRLNLMSKVTSSFGKDKRWSTDVKVQYMNNKGTNRPVSGINDGNYYATTLLLPGSIDIREFKEGMDVFGAQSYWYREGNSVNPYWAVKNKTNVDVRDRFLLNGTIKYKFNDWLDADFRAGSDIYTTKYSAKTYTGSPLNNEYNTRTDNFSENNFIVSLNAHQENIVGKWSASASIFGQIMKQNFHQIGISIGKLAVPNLFTANNSVGPAVPTEKVLDQQINSIYGTGEINYDGYWFINFTGRNDWSSTLSKQNRSFFYPSISTSFVVTDFLNKVSLSAPNWLTFAKIRASYAQTGNSLKPYQLLNTYTIGQDPNSNIIAGTNNTLYDENVVSELLKNYEFGFDVRLFNRLNVDFSYYKTNATNQLLAIPMNPLSGYNFRMINAGDIQNEGIELVLAANILNAPERLKWDMNVNFSRNRNTINKIYSNKTENSTEEELTQYPLGGYDNINIFGEKGKQYGSIYGTTYRRVTDKESEFYGQRLLNESGLPTTDGSSTYLGTQSPNFLLGITNTFAYKNFGLSFLVDGRFGGKFFSGTNAALKQSGLADATVIDGARESFIAEGVISNGQGGYVQNTKSVTPQQYWYAVQNVNNLGIIEENIFDATNVRLRNVQLSYTLPKSILKNSVVKTARFSLSANNLWMIYSKANGVDPESVFATGTNATGFENLSMPTSRSFFFNVSVGF